MSDKISLLPGFRDFYPQECALRNHIFARWRDVARSYGFVEFDGPVLESSDLYRRKSGDEIMGQLFHFTDQGGREVAMRPELTPSLARMVAARARDFRKPLKWFSIGQFFRFERPQKGRGREFYQLNCDILGAESGAADAELLALVIDLLRGFGLGVDDFAVRVSDRRAWLAWLEERQVAEENWTAALRLVDKFDPGKPTLLEEKLGELGLRLADLLDFIENPPERFFGDFQRLRNNLAARRLDGYLRLDPAIVRGLAYYTGMVFEVSALRGEFRAVAGGGRYDGLLGLMGGPSMPALGFGMGDMVLAHLLEATPSAAERLRTALEADRPVRVYVAILTEERRTEALMAVQSLREAGVRTDYGLAPAKIARQFEAAEGVRAEFCLLVGTEWPAVTLRRMATREELAFPGGVAEAVEFLKAC